MEFIYVNAKNLKPVVERLNAFENHSFGFDTETTGLRQSDKMFSMQLCDGEKTFYFNFNSQKDYCDNFAPYILNRHDVFEKLRPFLNNTTNTFYVHNAVFDYWMLLKDGVDILAKPFCTRATMRVLHNDAMDISLKNSLKMYEIGEDKSDAVKDFITKNKLYTLEKVEGKVQAKKHMHFDKVDHQLMFKYACQDAYAVYLLGERFKGHLQNKPLLNKVVDNENALVRPLAQMKMQGICIDKNYITEAREYTKQKIKRVKKEIDQIAGCKYEGGPLWLERVFKEKGYEYDITPKSGKILKDKKALKKYANPLSEKILELSRLEKDLGTYWSSFLSLQVGGKIHCDLDQAGTQTGRFSSKNPNLQNIPKEGAGDYDVRQAFVQSEGFTFFAIDYDQQEYRLLLDRAGEIKTIKDINDNGLDVHQATANMMDVSRTKAKTLNFGILYGMGNAALAEALGVGVAEAKSLKRKYFESLKKVNQWNWDVKSYIGRYPVIRNWFGRPLNAPPQKFTYKIANYLIQGGCGDIVKIAMNKIYDYLKQNNLKSRMVLQIHDELLFEIHHTEYHIVKDLKEIMENVYVPKNGLYLKASVSKSIAGTFSKSDLTDVSDLELNSWRDLKKTFIKEELNQI